MKTEHIVLVINIQNTVFLYLEGKTLRGKITKRQYVVKFYLHENFI